MRLASIPPEERDELWAFLHLTRGQGGPEVKTWESLLAAAPYLAESAKNREILAVLRTLPADTTWWIHGQPPGPRAEGNGPTPAGCS